jgi:hypothetical protein
MLGMAVCLARITYLGIVQMLSSEKGTVRIYNSYINNHIERLFLFEILTWGKKEITQ